MGGNRSQRPQCVICGFQGPAFSAVTCPVCRDDGSAPTCQAHTIEQAVSAACRLAQQQPARTVLIRQSLSETPPFQVSALAPWQVQLACSCAEPPAPGAVAVLCLAGTNVIIGRLAGNEDVLRILLGN